MTPMPRRKTIGRNPLAPVAVETNGPSAPRAPSKPDSATPELSWPIHPADSRQVVEIWAAAAEATFAATLEVYTALLATSVAAVDTTAANESALLHSWGALAEQAQEAAFAFAVSLPPLWVARYAWGE